MSINIYKDTMTQAFLFGKPVLYTTERIPNEDVPPHWSLYELCGTARDPYRPYALVDKARNHFVASILSPVTLKKESAQKRLINYKLNITCVGLTLTKFCADRKIPCPETPIRHQFRPASSEEAGLFYALPPERDEELGAIGHVRIDFGRKGKEFWHTWWPRGPEELNTPEFKEELGQVVDDLRKSVLRDLRSMCGYCCDHGGNISGGTVVQNYGYVLKTEGYIYRLRCNPTPGDYQAYLSCFVNQEQKMGLTEEGRQKLRNAADPGKPHTYEWYVIDWNKGPEDRAEHPATLEAAIQRYTQLDSGHKCLGVTKDDIASVDLVIKSAGREWLSEDRLKLDSFKDDPVVAGAVPQLQQMLEGPSHVQGMSMGGLS